MTILLLALLAVAAALWLLAIRSAAPEPAGPPQAPSAPRDPVSETVAKWMHDWDRGRA